MLIPAFNLSFLSGDEMCDICLDRYFLVSIHQAISNLTLQVAKIKISFNSRSDDLLNHEDREEEGKQHSDVHLSVLHVIRLFCMDGDERALSTRHRVFFQEISTTPS